MTSLAYLTPLPLYGSGGRSLRMFAAVSPTSCFVDPADVEPGGGLDLERDAGRRGDLDRMAEAERQLDPRPLAWTR